MIRKNNIRIEKMMKKLLRIAIILVATQPIMPSS